MGKGGEKKVGRGKKRGSSFLNRVANAQKRKRNQVN